MTMTNLCRGFLVALCLWGVVACGSSSPLLPQDGGAPSDGGAALDGGTPADGGAPADGGVSSDGGVPSDGGSGIDGGAVSDGGSASDGGVAYQDCPAPADGGPPARNLLVMNPGTGEVLKSLDLSCFAENADGRPRPFVMAQAGGKVYVALQDFDLNFTNHQNGKVVVIDPSVDRVLRKIDLAAKKNINELRVGPDGRLYAVAQGILGLDFSGFVVQPELSGGIDAIDPSTDTVVASVDDDDFGGNVTRVAFADTERAWAVVAKFDEQGNPRENRYHVHTWNPQAANTSGGSRYQASGAFVSGFEYEADSQTLYVAEADFASPRVVGLRGDPLQPEAQREVALALAPQGMALLAAGASRRLVLVEPDFTGGVGVVQTIDLEAALPHSAVNAPDPTSSDPVLRVTSPLGGGAALVFVINRFGADNIQWLDPATGFATRQVMSTPAQWSTGNGSNPQDVLAISEAKVYVTLQN